MSTKGIYAGSFDPLTNGHLDIIRRAAKLFDSVVIAVGINPTKKYSFSTAERISIIRESCADMPTVEVTSMGNDLLVHYAKSVNATHIVRGIRSHKDFDDESLMQRINKEIDSSVETVFFVPNKEFIDVSSSLVKALVGPKYWHYVVEKYVPKTVFNYLAKKELERYCAEHIGLNVALDNILRFYREEYRFYHNELHILDTFNELERVSDLCHQKRAIMAALLFHDIMDSEKESAELFNKMTGGQMSMVKKLIMATDHSRADVEEFSTDEKLIHDVDLMILASDPDVYDKYAENVFREYNAKLGINRDEFNGKRKEFLKKMLEKDKLFLHDAFAEYEQKARSNMKREAGI